MLSQRRDDVQFTTSQDRRPPNFDPAAPAFRERIRNQDAETIRDLRDHLDAEGVSPKTRETYLEAVERFAAFAASEGMPSWSEIERVRKGFRGGRLMPGASRDPEVNRPRQHAPPPRRTPTARCRTRPTDRQERDRAARRPHLWPAPR
jgi:hypothetical protein